MSDDVQLGPVPRPEVSVKFQPCKRCKVPTSNLGAICTRCLDGAWWEEILVQQVAALREHSMVELPMDSKSRQHVALVGKPRLTFCHILVPASGAVKKAQVDKLPPAICEECRQVVERLRRT